MKAVEIHQLQQDFFRSRKTFDIGYRINSLKKFKTILQLHEQDVYNALASDLGKSEFESFVTEFQVVTSEVETYINKTSSWSKAKKVLPTILNFPSTAKRYPEPYGNALIIAPWNYPFQLALGPLVGAIAAGNTVVLKPSEFSSATSKLLKAIIDQSFDPGHVSVVLGDGEVAQELTALKWDYLFFTGSPAVGKKIYQAAAKHLTPVTLELGGKNPAVVHESAQIKVCAKRIVWAKFLNTGQTCIAPDYLLVHHSIKDDFVKELKLQIQQFFGDNPKDSSDYARIIRQEHFDRLVDMISECHIITGGQNDRSQLYIAPTLVEEPDRNDLVMKEEIFGPILPIIQYKDQADLEKWILSYEKPLGAYIYSSNNKFNDWFINRFSFGGGVINDSIVQFLNERLPFGGVGNSGMGSYHGKKTFDTFSHYKSMVHRGTWLDIPIKYPPYNHKLSWMKRILDWI